MNEIGRGAQYKVFTVGTERVRKVPLTRQESEEVIASWYAPKPVPSEELAVAADYLAQVQKTCEIVQTATKKHHDLGVLLAHPRFEEDGVYTQDRVITIAQAFETTNFDSAQALIDQYIDLTLELWRHGVSERVFNFTVNNGVNKHGSVVLIDFGEITTDKAKVLRAIATRRWLRAYSYSSLSPELKVYYADAMGRRLTTGALEHLWATA